MAERADKARSTGKVGTELRSFAEGVAADYWQNIELLKADRAEAGADRHVLFDWSIVLGVLALENYEAILALLRAGKLRTSFMLARTLIDYHVRLRYYIRQAQANDGAESDATRDWQRAATTFEGEALNVYEPDEWPDEAQEAILAAFGKDEHRHRAEFARMCAFLEEAETEENAYRWARSAWLMETAFLHGDRAVIADVLQVENGTPAVHRNSPAAAPRTILFEALWYLLDIMDSFALVRGSAYGAVKARQDAIRLYLATK